MEQQTPGVYINELNAFPNSVVEVGTAVPVFIGYTAKANFKGEDLANRPRRVTSLKEFETYFGQGNTPVFDLAKISGGVTADSLKKDKSLAVQPVVLQINDLASTTQTTLAKYALTPEDKSVYYLYNCVRLFYQNGGAACYIISIGEYDGDYSTELDKEYFTIPDNPVSAVTSADNTDTDTAATATTTPSAKDMFIAAIDTLIYEQEPTMLVCPDALRLKREEYYDVAKAMLGHCNATQRRVAILDVYDGAVTDARDLNSDDNAITRFRTGVSTNYLKYGAAYFPWVNTTVVGTIETSFQNLSKDVFDSFVTAADNMYDAASTNAKKLTGKPDEAGAKQTLRTITAYLKLVKDAQRMHAPSLAKNLPNFEAARATQQAAAAATIAAAKTITNKADATTAQKAADEVVTAVTTAQKAATAAGGPWVGKLDAALKDAQDAAKVAKDAAGATDDGTAAAQNQPYIDAANATVKAIVDAIDAVDQATLSPERAAAQKAADGANAAANDDVALTNQASAAPAKTAADAAVSSAKSANDLATKAGSSWAAQAGNTLTKAQTAAALADTAAKATADPDENAKAAYAAAVKDTADAAAKAVAAAKDADAQAAVPANLSLVENQLEVLRLHNALLSSNADYSRLIDNVTRYRNTLPPAAAMAGVYTAVDTNRGVFKAPANVGLSGVSTPTVNLSDNDQARLNVDAISGKSINALRPFPGLGVLVWGARTLDGNSQDWKYINVRRTMIMLEQSIKLAARAYVFEPNVNTTWVKVQSMIESFLFNQWKEGALAGTKAEDAYSVAVGLGTTMTGDDVLNGNMNVFVKVAISKPAEFIVLSFQQQMQKS